MLKVESTETVVRIRTRKKTPEKCDNIAAEERRKKKIVELADGRSLRVCACSTLSHFLSLSILLNFFALLPTLSSRHVEEVESGIGAKRAELLRIN